MKTYVIFTLKRSSTKFLATIVIFGKLAKVNNPLLGAQSGHPA
jgi:hypothetical protein